MECITINDSYPQEFLLVFAKHGIKYPKVDEIVTVIGVEKYPRINKTGFILAGYEFQTIPGEIMGVKGEKQMTYDSKRFVHLDQTPIEEEEIKEMIKEQQKVEKYEN